MVHAFCLWTACASHSYILLSLQGILALLNVETGVEITEIEAGLTFILLLLFT